MLLRSFAFRLPTFKGPVVQREERQVENFTYIDVQRYLEQNKLDIDSHSTTTGTSDSGMAESHGTPSELGMGETSGKIHFIIKRIIRPRAFQLRKTRKNFVLDIHIAYKY